MVEEALAMTGAVIFGVIFAVLTAAEGVGLYNQHHDPEDAKSWGPLTGYVRAAPWPVRVAVAVFTVWLAGHFAIGGAA